MKPTSAADKTQINADQTQNGYRCSSGFSFASGWLASPEDRKSPDEAGSPALRVAELLKLPGSVKELVHLGSLASHWCNSTSPEDGCGGTLRTA